MDNCGFFPFAPFSWKPGSSQCSILVHLHITWDNLDLTVTWGLRNMKLILALLQFWILAANLLLSKCHFSTKPTGFQTLIYPKKYIQMNRLQPALSCHEANTLTELCLCFQKPHDRIINLIVQTSLGAASIPFPENFPRLLTVSWSWFSLSHTVTALDSLFQNFPMY